MQYFREMEQKREDTQKSTPRLCLDRIFPLGEVHFLLLLLLSLERSFVLGELPTDGTGSLGSEVERGVLLVLVEQPVLC